MEPLRLLYRDVDRSPFLYALRHAARARGVELDIGLQPGREYGELLQRDEVDILAENYYNLQTFRARGVPLVSLATSVTWMNEKLLVAPDIDSLDALRGKRFAIRGQGPQELITRLWLKDVGLDGAVEPIVVSEQEAGRWGQWRNVASGQAAGTFVAHLYADPALEAGLKELPIEPYGILGNVTLTTSRNILTAKRDALEQVVRAAFDAVRLFKTDRAQTLAVMSQEPAELLKQSRDFNLERTYEILRDELSDPPVPVPQAILNTHRMVLPRSPELAACNPLLMWDLSFASRIVEERAAAGSANR